MCWVQVIYTMCVRAGNRIYKSMNMRGTAQPRETTEKEPSQPADDNNLRLDAT